tara:strand:+ start:123 stop:371 length:249 start_codon:yes stop_codon:yes gene_type:complete
MFFKNNLRFAFVGAFIGVCIGVIIIIILEGTGITQSAYTNTISSNKFRFDDLFKEDSIKIISLFGLAGFIIVILFGWALKSK